MTRDKRAFIADLIAEVNHRNANSTCAPEVRRGWSSLLESVLHANDVYAGFNYLTADKLEGNAAGSPPGINFDIEHTGPNMPQEQRDARYPDESRVFYYVHEKLRDIPSRYAGSYTARNAATTLPCVHCGHGTTRRVMGNKGGYFERVECAEQFCLDARAEQERLAAQERAAVAESRDSREFP
jgi:hypothetical protein